jgi:membrane associated rhomboid family serine protease
MLGNFFTAAFKRNFCYMSVGAVTAIEGILAFEVIWFLFNIGNMGLSVLLYIIYYGTIFLTTVFGIFTPGYVVDYWGHLGGFIAGICITSLFYQAIAKNSVLRFLGFLLALVLVVLFVITGILIFSREAKGCDKAWCHHKFRIS